MMEDMSPVSFTLSLGNPVYQHSGISSHIKFRQIKFATESVGLLLDPSLMLDGTNSSCTWDSSHDCGSRMLRTTHTSEDRSLQQGFSSDIWTVSVKPNEIEPSKGKDQSKSGAKSVFEMDCVPLWGLVSLCGHRPEMEDAVTAAPHFMKIPIKMFTGDAAAIDGISQNLSQLSSHFFGVFDGHGGSEVANYCRDRIHMAFIDELNNCKDDIMKVSTRRTRQVQWEKVFTSCFTRVDDEVGRKVGGESGGQSTVVPETVGSTAVVAVVSASHIVVANCGDSRAVLYRGKEAIALSVDHKPNREDEYARIEACGGKVIPWNGHRVFGVLAMSRSIGDRYMKPSIIAEPEVMLVPRAKEDECLVLASDGLWDVMSNEEACEVARRWILIWHKRNGANPLPNRGQNIDPAAQSAAEYLSKLALQKGSKDNISIIVVDLKPHRKLKKNKSYTREV